MNQWYTQHQMGKDVAGLQHAEASFERVFGFKFFLIFLYL